MSDPRDLIDIEVHPAADVFPMLDADALADLAADIKANGLIHPIVLNDDGQIVDGRNRYAACKIAEVTAHCTKLPSDANVFTFVLSENIHRRHMSKGQQAMAIALMIETPEGKRDGTAKRLSSDSELSKGWVSEALAIMRHAPDLGKLVLAGTEKFDAALSTARARQQALKSDEQKRKDAEAKLSSLSAAAPDLAALVRDSALSLDEAVAALEQRERREADAKRAATALMVQTLDFLDPRAMTTAELADSIARRIDGTQMPTPPDLSPERLRRCAETLDILIGYVERGGEHGQP